MLEAFQYLCLHLVRMSVELLLKWWLAFWWWWWWWLVWGSLGLRTPDIALAAQVALPSLVAQSRFPWQSPHFHRY